MNEKGVAEDEDWNGSQSTYEASNPRKCDCCRRLPPTCPRVVSEEEHNAAEDNDEQKCV
jgi:hypothetical protein